MATDPFIEQNPVVSGLQGQRAREEQVQENSARLAQTYATFTTTGDGDHTLPDPCLFGCTFTEQPIVSYGYSMDGDQLQDDTAPLPRCSGFIRKWVQDARKHYIGAYVCFVVNTARVVAQAPDPVPTPDTNATPPPSPTAYSFSDNFDRANSALVGNGWTQTGGDWGVSANSVSTPDTSSYLCRGVGRISQTLAADMRSPDGASPAIFCWSNSTAGAGQGYALAFAAGSTGVNVVLLKSGQQVQARHFGPAGAAIGNATKNLKMSVTIVGSQVQVDCFVDGAKQFNTYIEDLSAAPTGTYSGFGNRGVGNVRSDNWVNGEIVVTATVSGTSDPTVSTVDATPASAADAEDVPVYIIDHDFTFTGIALKDLPDYLLDMS